MLVLGTDKTQTFLDTLPKSFLLIDDGPIIDALPHEPLDFKRHAFNPLKAMNYLRARQFLEILGAAFPQGENTLTKKNSDYILLKALTAKRAKKPKYLDTLIPRPNPKDTAALDAYQKIETILLSPVLKRVFLRPTNFALKGIILARLDRAVLGDFDCFLLGNLLISAYKGQVVVPDFGFYAIASHIQLVRQGRLTAGLDSLSELDHLRKLRNRLLVGDKIGHHTTGEDAETLANYSRFRRDARGYRDLVETYIENKS